MENRGQRRPQGARHAGATPRPPSLVRTTTPNAWIFLACVVVTVVTVVLAAAGPEPLWRSVVAVVLGMFGGIVLLGLARLDTTRKRGMGTFADWSVGFLTAVNVVVVVGWVAGLWALMQSAYEFSRHFT